MARARNIKPSFFKNEDLAELSFECRLLFIGLWTLADREGYLEDRPKRIKMEIFPGDSVNVDVALRELHAKGFIVRYQVGGNAFICVTNFLKHQNPHHRELPSTIPKPEAKPRLVTVSGPGLVADATTPKPEADPTPQGGPAGLNPDSLIPDSRILNPETGIPLRSNDSVARATDGGRLCVVLREDGVDVTPQNPLLLQWIANGVTEQDAREAVDRARRYKPKPERIAARYLDRIIADIVAEKAGAGPITIVGTRVAQPSQDAIGIASLQNLKEQFQ